MSDRLAAVDWLRHGLRVLTSEGPDGFKIGTMAARLNVTRGSFYWHFRDIDDFRAQVLQCWFEQATDRVIDELAAVAAPDRLKHLLRRAFETSRGLEQAMRSWATGNRAVAETVAAVDARRIAYISELLVAAGVDRDKADSRATFLYWAYLGQTLLVDARHGSIPAVAVDDVAGLFERV